MLKQIRWNKKRKWINTRYAKPYKARRAIKHIQMAQACAIGAQLVSAIAAASASGALQRASKAIAMAVRVMNTQRVVIPIADTLRKIDVTVSNSPGLSSISKQSDNYVDVDDIRIKNLFDGENPYQ